MLRRAGNIWYAIELVRHRSWVKNGLEFYRLDMIVKLVENQL